MSSEYGGYQIATPPPYYTTKSTYATSTYYAKALKFYTTKAQELRNRFRCPNLHHRGSKYYTTKYAAPVYYAEVPK